MVLTSTADGLVTMREGLASSFAGEFGRQRARCLQVPIATTRPAAWTGWWPHWDSSPSALERVTDGVLSESVELGGGRTLCVLKLFGCPPGVQSCWGTAQRTEVLVNRFSIEVAFLMTEPLELAALTAALADVSNVEVDRRSLRRGPR